MSAVIHPHISREEFAAVMDRHGWAAPLELIAGEVVFVTPTGGSAALAQVNAAHALLLWQGTSGGRVLTDVFVQLGEDYLAPDVAWWCAGREPEIAPGAVISVPDLVIEVLSPATRANDLGPKRHQSLQGGVQELWLIDPATRTAVVVSGGGDRVVEDELTSALLPGFALPLAR